MAELNVLILGDGLLGKEIVNQTGWNFISRKKDNFNIEDTESFDTLFKGYNVIINCIANTNTYSKDRQQHWDVNYKFVNNLIEFCNKSSIKLVHISTDYIYAGSDKNSSESDVPVHTKNWYGYTKLLGDGLVQLLSKDYLLCRCMHKVNPFPYDEAWIDQVGNFDYVDVIASKIIELVNSNLSGVYNVGTELKSIYELASRTKKVNPVFSPEDAPKNISMDVSKLNRDLSNSHPFFSIAIPAYGYNGNGSDFLEHSFKIMALQSFKDFEVVVSDHSTDDTIKNVCKKWKSKLNIFYIRNENGRGIISPNLNSALFNCKGKWVKILFQDDFLLDASSLERHYNFIKSNPDMKWMATRFCHSNDGKTFYRDFYPQWVDNIWTGNNLIGCPSVVAIKKENVLYFDEDLNWLMDCEYYQRMFSKYGKPLVLGEHTVVNRTNPDRLTNSIPESQKISEFQKLKKIYG
jgi:dTDP-4-dehydrorhamnose reductase